MTGDEFQKLRKRTGHTLRSLQDRWGVDYRTVHAEEQKDEVRGLYADALIRVAQAEDVEIPPSCSGEGT
jgi:hypothetical protein